MRNPILNEIRRVRARRAREWAQNPDRDYVAASRARLLEVRDAVIDENGKTRYVTNARKMYDVLIAPRLAENMARSTGRVRRRRSSSRSKDAARQGG